MKNMAFDEKDKLRDKHRLVRKMRGSKAILQNFNSLITSIDQLSAYIKADERVRNSYSYMSEPNSPDLLAKKPYQRPPNYYSPDMIAAKRNQSRMMYKTLCSKKHLNRKILTESVTKEIFASNKRKFASGADTFRAVTPVKNENQD